MANTFTLTDPKGKAISTTYSATDKADMERMGLAQGYKFAPTPLPNPVPATSLQPATPVNLPQPTATDAQMNVQDSVAGTVATSRANLDKMYADQKATIDKELEALKASRADTLAKAKPLTEPFREELETKERKRLSIETNFQENQKLTNQLDALLQQGNNMIARKNGVSMNNRAAAIRTQRTIEDVQARAGVIEAVINARNNQITVAQNMIDRSVEAIVADRTDSLNYYNTLLEMDNSKILTLDKESKEIATAQVELVKGDLEKAEATAEYIKGLMVNPETASFMADAGVSLTDSVEEIQEKMAKQVKIDQVRDARNKLVEAGYELVAYPTGETMPIEVGDTVLYAKVRPGSEQALKLEQLRASIESTNALANQRSGSGGGVGGGGVYADDMDALQGNVLAMIPTKFGQEQFQKQLANARNDQDRLNLLAGQILKAQPAEVKRDFANQAVGLSEIDKAIALIDSGTQTGALQAGTQYVYNIVGKDYDPKLAAIAQHLTAAIQPYRNSVTGAAWGEQETAEYAQLFGSTKYEPEELKQRLMIVKEVMKNKSAQTLNAYANPLGFGDNQFAAGLYTPGTGLQMDVNAGVDQQTLEAFDLEMGTSGTTAEQVDDGGYLSNLWGAIWGK